MPVILYAPSSPYSAKVRMAAAWCGLDVESRVVDSNNEQPELLEANPLGKIPTLLTDEGAAIYDSRVITQHLNRVSKGALFPRNADRRLEAEQLEALADGLCDALLAIIYESRFRPEDKRHEPWTDRQWRKAVRVLDHLEGALPRLTGKADGGRIALRAALGYLDLRFADTKWRRGRAKLSRWAERFDRKFPELAALIPSA